MMDQYLKDIAKVLGFAGGAATLPLIAAFANLQPPWPPAIEYVSAVFILMAALVMWEWGRATRRTARRRLIVAGMLLTVIGIGAYLPLYSLYVEAIPGSGERVVKGMTCTPEARQVWPGKCPHLPPDALPSAEWDASLLWTAGSIMGVRLMLVAAWLAFTAGLVAFVGAVIAGRPIARTRRAAPES